MRTTQVIPPQKGGKNSAKQWKKWRDCKHISNQRKDFLHKHSRRIERCDAVCIEDLNMRGMAQSLNFGKSVSDNGWGMFTSFLGYKLTELRKVPLGD